jgi:hypothetical protein
LLLLPVVVGILPIWLSSQTRLSRRYKSGALIALAAFAVLVLAGYAVPWIWTGFTGNRLWDWLELLALPVALALTPMLGAMREGWTTRHSIVTSAALAVFIAIVVAGYVWNWGWTGFRGNTLWNWLQLLLLPLLVPMIVVPALKPRAMSTVTFVEHNQEPESTAITDDQPASVPVTDQGAGAAAGDQRPREPATGTEGDGADARTRGLR